MTPVTMTSSQPRVEERDGKWRATANKGRTSLTLSNDVNWVQSRVPTMSRVYPNPGSRAWISLNVVGPLSQPLFFFLF